ncbi:GHKL domain-containing protein [Lachnospiraceae bacterium]|jgi:two-component system sensor histidine kinase AgrC|nr:GHKL domain-containing protein [uncultured Schaedlerella sp.]MCI9152472.1 GHKL domain-containing protein [Ruminococcus sp.]NBI56545.1 GHKL domain-containing protein [Lachnospiraceae bacterium]
MSWVEFGIWNGILMCMETVVLALCTWFFLRGTGQDRDEKKKLQWGAAVLYWMGLAGITFGFQDSRSIHLILLAYMVFMTMLTGRQLYNRRRIYQFYYFLFPVTMAAVRIFVIYMVFAYMSSRWGSMIFDYALTNTALVIRQLTEILLTGAWAVVLNRKKYEHVKGIQFAGLFLAPAVSVFIIFSLIYTGDVFVQLYGAFLILLNILALVVMNLYIWYLFSYQSKNKKLRAELEIRKKQSEMLYQYYEKVEQRYQYSRKMIHDMRNHLQAIEALQEQDTDKGKEYVRNMRQMLDDLGIVNYTDNRMFNIILNDKAEEAKKSGIGMEIRIGEIRLEHIRDMDMTTIFANLLDNALEAAEQAEGKRMIRVQADTFHDFTVVKIRNSMPCAGGGTKAAASAEKVCAAACGLEKPDVQFMSLEGAGQKEPGTDGLEQKEKRGRKSHMGIGLENVRHTLEKYEGGMMTEVLGGEFVVSLTIPV